MSEVKSQSMKASSEKLTTKASSCGFEAWIRSSALLLTEGRLRSHGPGVVDHQAHGDGKIGVLEADDVLLDPVFVDLKIVFGQVLNQLRAVEHGGVEHHFFDVGVEQVALAFLAEVPVGGTGGTVSGERTGSVSCVSDGDCAAGGALAGA